MDEGLNPSTARLFIDEATEVERCRRGSRERSKVHFLLRSTHHFFLALRSNQQEPSENACWMTDNQRLVCFFLCLFL